VTDRERTNGTRVQSKKGRRAMKTTIFALVCVLFTVPSLAEAECAWVLWEEDKSSVDKWRVLFAQKTQESCEGLLTEVLKGFVAAHREEGQRIESGDRFYTGTTAAGDRRIIAYHCLPETVDPRGPKGK